MSKLLVGRYELIERVGEGGMAVVYKAKDRLLNRFVAVKILRPEFARDDQFVDSFRKESQAAAGLQHPNIVSVYDVGREGDIQFIVMEFIDGMTLSDVIHKTGPMDYKEVVRISKQVASALNVAHQNNIIHRDIKPHNIMMTREGNVKLGDFGIAKAISDATMTETKVIGSVHYFSPEQARGAYVDERSDIYSLGIIMYEMLTGKVPFDGDNPVQVALMHINDDIVPPSQVVPGVPPALEKIVMKATDKFQTNRYRNAEELFKDLDSIEYVSKMVGDDALVNEPETEPQIPVWQQTPHTGKSTNMKHTAPQERVRQPVTPVSKDRNEDDEPADERRKKGGSGKILIALLIIALLAVAGVYAAQTFGLFDREIVPDVTNMSYSRAEKILSAKGFQARQGNEIVSNDVDKGKVAAQDPNGGDKAKKGATVTLDISAGKATGTVPNMVGKYYDDDTHTVIEGYGFKLGDVDYEKSDAYDKNQIMSQTPSANSAAVQGTSIDIVVCSGKKQSDDTARVPSLSGLSASQAKDKIRSAGFSVGTISYDESNVYGAGYVMEQQYEAGTSLKKGSYIGFTVSKGKPSSDSDSKTSSKKDSDSDSKKTTEKTDDQKKTDTGSDSQNTGDNGSGGSSSSGGTDSGGSSSGGGSTDSGSSSSGGSTDSGSGSSGGSSSSGGSTDSGGSSSGSGSSSSGGSSSGGSSGSSSSEG